MKAALIDGDSIIYILGWQFKNIEQDGMDTEEANNIVRGAVDQLIIGILQACDATHYTGATGSSTKGARCFRYNVAKYKPYKANRREPDEWVRRWKPIILERLQQHWHFTCHDDLEADDIISLAAEKAKALDWGQWVVCSPDKDLRQIAGTHYDYKKIGFADVTELDAAYNLWFQMLTGDGTDGVAGLPGCGPKKATEKLSGVIGIEEALEATVRGEYYRYFGDHYGKIIFEENLAVLSLVTSKHPFFEPEMMKAVELYPADY